MSQGERIHLHMQSSNHHHCRLKTMRSLSLSVLKHNRNHHHYLYLVQSSIYQRHCNHLYAMSPNYLNAICILSILPAMSIRYNISGFVEELPKLPEKRYYHACSALPATGVRSTQPTLNCRHLWLPEVGVEPFLHTGLDPTHFHRCLLSSQGQ